MNKPKDEPIIYKSGTSPGLGAGWEVLQVVQRNKGAVTLARNADGKIMRKTDSVPETWEVIRDEEMLRFSRQCFDDRDKAHEAKADAEDASMNNEMVSQYVRLVLAPNTRKGTITDTKIEHGHIEYLFHHDERFDNRLPDFWAMEGDFEPCDRPTDEEVDRINMLIRRGSL
jgi:hypothetical protein